MSLESSVPVPVGFAPTCDLHEDGIAVSGALLLSW